MIAPPFQTSLPSVMVEMPADLILVHTDDEYLVDMVDDGHGRTQFVVAGRPLSARRLSSDIRAGLAASGLFDSPHAIGLLGSLTHRGVEAMIVLVVESVVPPAAGPPSDDPAPRVVILGMAVRPHADRLSASVEGELQSMLSTIVGAAATMTLDQQAIENLLRSL